MDGVSGTNAPYRMQDVAGQKQLSPEDEMRLILAKADERPLKGMLIRRAIILAVSTACVIYGGLEGIFWVVLNGAYVAWIIYDLTRRARLMKRLKTEGVAVPDSLRT